MNSGERLQTILDLASARLRSLEVIDRYRWRKGLGNEQGASETELNNIKHDLKEIVRLATREETDAPRTQEIKETSGGSDSRS